MGEGVKMAGGGNGGEDCILEIIRTNTSQVEIEKRKNNWTTGSSQ